MSKPKHKKEQPGTVSVTARINPESLLANERAGISLDSLTIGQAREIAAMFGGPVAVHRAAGADEHPFSIGANYFIRTVTHHYTGRLMAVYPTELVITDAAWIADDGRFAAAVAKGEFGEVEPYPDGKLVVIGRGSLLDACIVSYRMPRSQK